MVDRQEVASSEFLKKVVESIEDIARNTMVIKAERGYGRSQVVDEVKKLGFLFILLMPSKILRCHSVVAILKLVADWEGNVENIDDDEMVASGDGEQPDA